MSDQPITKREMAEILRHRQGKPPSRALHKDIYRNPIYSARLTTERIAAERKKMWK